MCRLVVDTCTGYGLLGRELLCRYFWCDRGTACYSGVAAEAGICSKLKAVKWERRPSSFPCSQLFFFWYCLEEDPKNAVMTQSHTSFLKNCIFIFNICIGTRDESLRPGLADRKNKYPLSVTSLLRPLKLCYCLNSFSRFSFCSEWNNFQGSSQILFRNRCLEIPSQHFNKND